ncbi:MFS transporter [Arthrobacter sp. StoSoilB5]|uniref:MFS transporter n=1 Tax=Arthrobacter sp. StoSoilB5 TaxID=2830992 RepID=UPI001CC39A08|nr:MFS transporter [Arthrobacter sp. StoSoilB5]
MSKESRRSVRRSLLASLFGSTLEFYDFILFGLAAALVFPHVFFPGSSPAVGLLSSFATFAVGFVARPIGAIIAGHFGDRIGRRRILIFTLAGMGIATGGIGLIPSYESIGIWAPVLLVACRILQGLSLGGEWGGSVLMAVEQTTGTKNRGLLGSLPQLGDPLGVLLANGAFALVSMNLPKDALMSWGWRVPFILGMAIIVVGVWTRAKVVETPEFRKRMAAIEAPVRQPLISLLRAQPLNFLLSMGCRVGNDVAFYMVTVFAITYVTQRGLMESSAILVSTMVSAALGVILVPVFGLIADRIGLRKMTLIGLVGLGIGVAAYFPLLNLGQPGIAIGAAVFTCGIAGKAFWAPYAGFLSTIFPPETRYTGMSFSFQLSGIVGGGIAPFVAAWILGVTGSSTGITIYALVAVAVSIICVSLVKSHATSAQDETSTVSGTGAIKESI